MPADNHIQPYAFVVVLQTPALEIQAASQNLLDYLGEDAGAVIGKPATVLFSETLLQTVVRNQHHRVPVPQPISDDTSPVAWGRRQVIAFFVNEQIVLELEPVEATPVTFDREVALHAITTGFSESQRINKLLDYLCAAVAEYIELDRVLVYQFEEKGQGVVRNEYNNGKFPSLLGIMFRPDDYPPEGFRLHAEESVLAFCADHAADTAMMGEVGAAANIINYRLGCRTPYPVLRQFAEESGIQTLVSVAIFVDGKPWGVLFGHSRNTITLNYQLRTFLHLVGTLASQTIAFRIVDKVRQRVLQSDVFRSRLREVIASAPNLIEGLTGTEHSVMHYINDATGAAVLVEDRLIPMGVTPPEAEIRKLLLWARDLEDGQSVWSTHHLEAVYATDGRLRKSASGLILVPLNLSRTEWIAWFRPEKIEEITFGSLEDSMIVNLSQFRFNQNIEVRRGYSLHWSTNQLKAAAELQSFIRDVIMERYSQLRRINQQLSTAYSEMEDFSYMVSHDLRAPLRGIDGFAEILLEEYGKGIDEDGRELIQVIQHNAARMNQFIADILELSRVGRAKIFVNQLDVATIVREVVEEISSKTGEKVEVRVLPDLPPLIGDAIQMRVVFNHLISNAVKFSRLRERPEVSIGFRPTPQGKDGEFYISDNGIGISTQHQQRVFGMFNRLVTPEEYPGNGVGLAIVRRIISRHHGDIRIESSAGKGATFLFYTNLPFPGIQRTKSTISGSSQ